MKASHWIAAGACVGATAVLVAAVAPAPKKPVAAAPGSAWRRLEAGLELGEFAAPLRSDRGDSIIRALRIEPSRFELRLLNASAEAGGRPLTARQWCARAGLVAAINASMFQADHRTSVSLMRTSTHTNNRRLSKDRAVLAFEPRGPGVPAAMIIDRECDDFEALQERYGTLVQSIRMISCKGENVWSRQERRWSTAAIGADARGRILFLHVRSPYATHDLIDGLLALPLGLARAMYVEGGPEAQLYVASGGEEHEWVGGYETRLDEKDDNQIAWPIPNVVAIARRGSR